MGEQAYDPVSMARALALVAALLAAACTRPSTLVVQPTTQVTVVQQTTVQQTVPVQVTYGRPFDCDMMCRTIERSCEQACAPTSWSPNMQAIADSCEQDCDFQAYVCVGDCVRSGGSSRMR
jgi:hypothetical protein